MKRVAYHDIIISITMSNPPISVLSTHLINTFIMLDLHNQEIGSLPLFYLPQMRIYILTIKHMF